MLSFRAKRAASLRDKKWETGLWITFPKPLILCHSERVEKPYHASKLRHSQPKHPGARYHLYAMEPHPAPIHFGVLDPNEARKLPGIELLQGMIAGKFPSPPIAKTLNFRLAEVEPGRALFIGNPSIDVYNPLAIVHGGYVAVLLDSAMGVAVHSKLAAGQFYTTLEFKINFVRPLLETTGEVRAEGHIVHFGKRSATSQAKLTDAAGKLYAHGSTTCLIL
jgi:uncharacterized protein (TIGR00369 family)